MSGNPASLAAGTSVPNDGSGAESFYACHLDYPRGGMSDEELANLRNLVGQIVAAAAPPAEPLYFVFPGYINPDTWKAVTRAHAVGWQWTTGHAYRMDPPSAPPQPNAYKRYLSSLMKAFPEQAQRLQQAMAESEGPRGELTHRLLKTKSYEQIFRGRPWVSPAEAFLGTGGFAMFCVKDPDAFFQIAAAVTGRSGSTTAQGLAFLIPIFTREALAGATRETLRKWFGLFDLYIVECGYSRGLLIASNRDYSAALEAEFRNSRVAGAASPSPNGLTGP